MGVEGVRGRQGCVVSVHTDGYHRGGSRPEDQHVQIEGRGKKQNKKNMLLFPRVSSHPPPDNDG